MGDNNLPDTLTASVPQPLGRLVPCVTSLNPIDICQESLKIGRAAICDVIIGDSLENVDCSRVATISKVHCLLTKEADDKFYVTDLSKNGTFLNRSIIGKSQKAVLKNNDKIGCCKMDLYVFQYSLQPELPDTLTASDSSPLSLTPRAVIPLWGRLIACKLYLTSCDLSNLTFKVGRSSFCDVVIDEMEIDPRTKKVFSKEHFMLVKDPDTLITYITDLSSSGTYLNGRFIGKNCKNVLQHDDVIAIGSKKMSVYVYKSMSPSEAHYLPEELKGKYEPCRLLGRGACGEVKLAYEKVTCKKYAIKNILKSRSTTSQMDKINHPTKIRTEMNILTNLSHPFIIAMEEIVETPNEVFIVLEYMQGGELRNRILSMEPLTESNVKFFFYQMTLAVNYLHSKGIAHRDLKPENLLLASDEPETLLKVSDFGLSKFTEDDDMRTKCGTWSYIAPEILNSQVQRYDKQVDVWSLGVVLYYMLSKQLPFNMSDQARGALLIKKGMYKMEGQVWQGISAQAKGLIRRMLTVDSQERITISEVLNHPWLDKDVSMQYRVMSLLNGSSDTESTMSSCNMEPPSKRVRFSSDESE